MKKLLIYYTHSGNGTRVALKMKELGYELREVIPKHKLPKSFFWSVMTGGMLAGMNHKSKLKDMNYDISEYDEIVIASPIWNGGFACPMNTVMKNIRLENKSVSFIFYSGSGEGPKALAKVNKLYPDAKVIFLKEPKKYKEELEKLGV